MKNEAKNRIEELTDRFRRNVDVYKNGTYNETQVRREFIDPFFEILGWDVANKAGYAEQYKDVVHEDSIKVGVSLKAPDYSFRIGGQRKFFLEAKKPQVKIKEDVGPAYQLRRYAWSAKLPLSIVTDFEEFAVYDCRVKPDPSDKVSLGRTAYYTYDQYLEKFDEIYDTFSKDAVLKGSFDRYIESTKVKKGTGEVDREFLKEIEKWRDSLARNLALRNPELDIYELNFAVQHTIDRIIFLRICEDRGIEGYGRLQGLLNGANGYERLLHLFTQADKKYNSGLFDFKADNLSHNLKIDDKVLKEIIENLYYPKSPYEFSVIGAEILGNVYEQFLGKVIRLTAGHQAKVEEKPEVKKAGGVYYTPQYIVEYIVKNTVGRLLDNGPSTPLKSTPPNPLFSKEGVPKAGAFEQVKPQARGVTPKDVSAIRVLDPACGSGSFLIGAYQYLLDWHLKWYRENDPEKHAKGKTSAIYMGAGKEWRLTTQEKKRILLNNIYGVDIDRQAVEVTKLSLLLKLLEDENQETVGKTLALFQERVLPSLENNIKCGNSLIGPDFYNQMEMGLADDDIRRINVFDWEKEFPQIFPSPLTGEGEGGGGFDAVIGNPPYVRQEMLGEFKPYFQSHYKTYHGVADLYVYFIEQSHRLLKPGGLFGIICSNKFMRANYGRPIRDFLAHSTAIRQIVDFGELPVFQNAATFPAVILTENRKTTSQMFTFAPIKRLDFQSLDEEVTKQSLSLDEGSLKGDNWTLAKSEGLAVYEKIRARGKPLGEYVHGKIHYGIKTGLDKAFVIDRATRDHLIAANADNANLIKPYVAGDDVRNYHINIKDRYLIVIPRGWTSKAAGKPLGNDAWKWFKSRFPAIAGHLEPFAEAAQKRWDKGDYWWELRACDYYPEFDKSKIVWPEIAKESRASMDFNKLYFPTTCFFAPVEDKYLLGILNSKTAWFFLKHTCSVLGDADNKGRLRLKKQYLQQLPIRTIDFKNPKDKTLHDKMVSLVDRMLDLNKKLQTVKIAHDKELLERQIKITDDQIDRLVYELYGLTEEEKNTVEEANR